MQHRSLVVAGLLVASLAAVVLVADAHPLYSRQLLPPRPGYVPVYIRYGDTPLEEINLDIAEAFHAIPSGRSASAQRRDDAVVDDGRRRDAESESVAEAVAEAIAEDEKKDSIPNSDEQQPAAPTKVELSKPEVEKPAEPAPLVNKE